jgi:hypothetical protein
VGPRTDLDDVEKRKFLTLPGLELRPLGRPARSQSLYRLRFSGSYKIIVRKLISVPYVVHLMTPSATQLSHSVE